MLNIEKRRVELVESITNDVNKAVKAFNKNHYRLNIQKLEKAILRAEITVEEKKRQLMDELHKSIIKTVSVNPGKISKEELLGSLQGNLKLIRKITRKLIHLNSYLATTFLEETGLYKKYNRLQPRKLNAEARNLNRDELKKIEHTVYKLIEKVIILDSRLLKDFKKRDIKVTTEENTEIIDLEELLKKETEILYHIEAKLPPPGKVKPDLIRKPHFDYWTASLLALLTALRNDYQKEEKIFTKLKKDKILKKKLSLKIDHIRKEKKDMLQIKETRLLMAEKVSEMDAEWKYHTNNWSSVSDL